MIFRRDDIPADLMPYFVRAEIGLEPTPDAFVAEMVAVFREVRRVLADDGTLWLNLGDSYSSTGVTQSTPKARGGRFGSAGGEGRKEVQTDAITVRRPDGWSTGVKPKDLIGIPWRVAFALQADGWYLRSDIIWHKPNPMPESVTDRPTSAHEHVFLLAKSARYFYDADAVREAWADERKGASGAKALRYSDGAGRADTLGGDGRKGLGVSPDAEGRNLRNVWTVATQPFSGAHFATFPPALIEPCIKAGSRPGDTVLDPFGGAGTTGLVADRLGRNAVLIELNPEYAALAQSRIQADAPLFAEVV